MTGFDFFLDFEDYKSQFESFDDFAEKCEEVDKEVAIDYDLESATFYDYSLETMFPTKRVLFVKNTLEKSGQDYKKIWLRQVECQRAFRAAMARYF